MKDTPPPSMRDIPFIPLIILLIVIFGLGSLTSHAVTPQPVQLCPISANTFAVPSKPTDSLRTLNTSNIQNCIAFGSLTSDLKLYGGNPHTWHTQAELGVVIPTSPVVTPPVTPTCPDTTTFVPLNWTCSVSNGTATCTAAVSP